MLPVGSRVIAAVSGGPDSVCLLHVMRELRYELTGVAHFNHKLRGEASDRDEHFVAGLAAKLELPFYTQSSDLRNLAGNSSWICSLTVTLRASRSGTRATIKPRRSYSGCCAGVVRAAWQASFPSL